MTTLPLRFSPDLARAIDTVTVLPGYAPTPLHRTTAHDHRPLWLKDERARLGLGTFKALGGMHAATLLAGKVARGTAMVCASAGNHGAAVTAGALRVGHPARVHLPSGTSPAFAARIERMGGEVRWSTGDYETACREAREDAEASGAIWLPDGDLDPHAIAPHLVMEGYQVLAEEIREDCAATGAWPARVYLQAGIGGLAAAIAHHIRHHWPVQPEIIVVEPDAAPCLAASAAAGRPVAVTGPVSIMGRLDCKEPSWLAWSALAALDVRYATVSDAAASAAAAVLTALGYATTPSGAAGAAAQFADIAVAGPALAILTEGVLPMEKAA